MFSKYFLSTPWLLCSFSWHCLFLNINNVVNSTLSLLFDAHAFGLASESLSFGSCGLSSFSSSRRAVILRVIFRSQMHFDLLLWRLTLDLFWCTAVHLRWQGYISTFLWHFITTTTGILHTGLEILWCFATLSATSSRGWSWTSDSFASISQVLGLYAFNQSHMVYAGNGTQNGGYREELGLAYKWPQCLT